MGQDSEEAAEFWFMGDSDAAKELRAKHGKYPDLWKEVLNWSGWKEARKTYLKEQSASSQTQHERSVATGENVARKRKSRWGSAAPENTESDAQKQRSSRWASAEVCGNNGINPALPLPVLPGMPTAFTLTPQKQQEMMQLQGRLREINEKIENIDRDAARVDALPRDHRDRSPSPPPGRLALERLCSDVCCITLQNLS
jgi:hypothetical protein